MPNAKSAPVTGTQGNVIFCNFGATPAEAVRNDGARDEALAGIRAAIAEINGMVSETFTQHNETAILERDATQLLLKALDSMDIVAFQSRILLAGADECVVDEDAAVATSLWRFLSAGAAVSHRLHALAQERRAWIGAEERMVREIAAQAAQLETTSADCVRTMRGDLYHSDAAV